MNNQPSLFTDEGRQVFFEAMTAFQQAMLESLTQIVEEIRVAFAPSFDALERLRREIVTFSQIDWQAYYIEMGLWQAVDARDLTPDQRWQYQRWVWGAPIRWLRRAIERDEDAVK